MSRTSDRQAAVLATQYATLAACVGAGSTNTGEADDFVVATGGKSRMGSLDVYPPWAFRVPQGTHWRDSREDETLVTRHDLALPAGTTGLFFDRSASRPIAVQAHVHSARAPPPGVISPTRSLIDNGAAPQELRRRR